MTINFADKREVSKEASRIILSYCRKFKSGYPMVCTASYAEEAQRESRRNKRLKNKYIYDTYEIAEACASELTAKCGWAKQTVYVCHRSKHGHCHLSSKNSSGLR